MNRRSPGRKRCCHTEALHAGYHVYSSHGWFLSRIIELSNCFFHTEHRGESRFFCPELSNCRIFLHTDGRGGHGLFTRVFFLSRIIEFANWFIFTRRIAESHGVLSRIIELSNFFSHGESRRVSGFMSRIIELSNFFSHGESRRFSLSRDMFFVTNLRDLSLDPLTNGR